MGLKINIPSSAKGITLKQYLDYQAAVNDQERLTVATGLNRDAVDALAIDTVDELLKLFVNASNSFSKGTPGVVSTKYGKLGFIPDLSSMSLAEYVDLDEYSKSCYKENNLNGAGVVPMMAILFRPVSLIAGDYYEIEPYKSDGTARYKSAIEQLDMETVTNALLFFSLLEQELIKCSLASLEDQIATTLRELNTEMTTSLTRQMV
jgi:hypothetical protein